jgi:NTP pyrophosphatase (non-canonical NTP hydrolase)
MGGRGGAAQRRVRETMLAAGGYWRPLAAVARLLEELGELSELLGAAGTGQSPQLAGDSPELAGELADLWIITTALADQFLAEVAEPGTETGGPATEASLPAAAGPIARVVNHYDGPKVPRAGAAMPSLHGAVSDFHASLGALAAAHGVELAGAVAAKIEEIHRRGDVERFADIEGSSRRGFDPSTAPVLARFAATGVRELPSRLWGAPEPLGGQTPGERAAALVSSLEMFAKAARAEDLEGYVIEGPRPAGLAGGNAWLGALIAAIDPTGNAARFELAGVDLQAILLAAPRGAAAFALVAAAS